MIYNHGRSYYCRPCARLLDKEKERQPVRINYLTEYRKTSKWKNIHSKSSKKYIEKNPERQKARELAQKHVELKNYCEDCKTTTRKLHRHHPDYNKPLEVISLCQPCHELYHHPLIT